MTKQEIQTYLIGYLHGKGLIPAKAEALISITTALSQRDEPDDLEAIREEADYYLEELDDQAQRDQDPALIAAREQYINDHSA